MSDSGQQPAEGGADDQPGCSSERADPDPSQRIEVIADTAEVEQADIAWLSEQFAAAVNAMGAEVLALNIVLIDDDHMRLMHTEYHDDPTTTDVLTFDLRDEPFDGAPEAGLIPAIEGEVYVCADEAARQAGQRGHALRHELLLYALHGLLHLAGYDDHDDEDRARMHRREDELLNAIGVGPVYGGAAG